MAPFLGATEDAAARNRPTHPVANSHNPNSKRIAIIGGGITGLTAAWRLNTRGHRVRLFEAEARFGGAVRSQRIDDWLVEAGPNSLHVNAPEVAAVLGELGLESKILAANPIAQNRYIVRGGRLRPVPLSSPDLLTSRLFSMSGKLRILAELLARPRQRTDDLSLAAFVREHFGREFADYLLDPFISGIYAGDPEKLSACHAFPLLGELESTYGSLLRGHVTLARERRARGEPPLQLISFAEGLQTLTDAFALALPSHTVERRAKIDALLPGPPWEITWQRDGGARTEEADAVILALPAAALAALRVADKQPLSTLVEIEHPPVASLFLGFRREDITHPLDGFGLLAPACERRGLLGAIFSSTLFSERAPAGHVAITVMAGGVRQPELARLAPDALLATVMPDLRELLGVHNQPVFTHHAFWPRAIPQYNLGYGRFLATMSDAEKKYPGLFIGGHVRDGIALGACISSGLRLAGCAAS
jgi:protoporphyrinogen/coproporphyrinogen III oxidase